MRAGLERMYGGKHDGPERDVLHHGLQRAVSCSRRSRRTLDVDGIVQGHLPARTGQDRRPARQLLASGVAVPWALEAQRILAEDWGVSADVWSVTSWTELRRDGLAAEEDRLPQPRPARRASRSSPRSSPAPPDPVVAVTDYMKAVPDQIRQFVPNEFATRSARTASVSPTPAPPPAASSRSTSTRWSCARCRCWPRRGEVDAPAPAAGHREVPPAQRERRHHRQRGRRLLTGRPRQTARPDHRQAPRSTAVPTESGGRRRAFNRSVARPRRPSGAARSLLRRPL